MPGFVLLVRPRGDDDAVPGIGFTVSKKVGGAVTRNRMKRRFRELARALKRLGCRVGIEYFGQRFAQGERLADLGLDYIKIHPSYVHGIADNPGNQEFLRGLCTLAHTLGISVIAVGVEARTDLRLLADIGFDGATGPGLRQ